jgi:2-dehydro-3-deoxygluconokinase
MAVGNVDMAALRACRVLHLSGITAALSEDCLELLRELTAPRPGRPLVSFDVNFRPGLWRDADGPRVLLELARRADLVFVGDDEARQAWGLHGVRAVRDALPEPKTVIVKQGAGGATACDRDTDGLEDGDGTATFVRAPTVDVVAHVGAGDAFAAGFLSATLRQLPVRDRLRHGHLMAAAALTVPGDLAGPPARDHADRLAALDEAEWGRLRLGPGWTQGSRGTEEKVHTP